MRRESQGAAIITSFSAEPGSEKKSVQSKDSAELRFSLKQPVWHVIVLSVLTFKIYLVYWCYKNWRDLSLEMDKKSSEESRHEVQKLGLVERLLPDHLASFKDVSPMLRAMVCLFPYINNYLYFTLVLGIARIYPVRDSFVAKHSLLSAIGLLIASVSLSCLAFLPGAYYLLFLLSALPIALAQHWLNRYWDSVEDKSLLVRHGFSLKELVTIIAGALVLGYICSSFLLGPAK